MAQLSINELTTYRWSFDEDVLNYRAAQIPAIGVWRQKLADFGEERGVELLAESGLAVSNLLWAGGFTGSDGHSHHERIRDGIDAVRLAAALGAECLVVHSGGRNNHTYKHARRLFLTALGEMLPAAHDLGVTLVVEPMHTACASEWTFLTSLDEAVDLIDFVDSPALKLAFDTYHLGHDPHVLDQIAQLGGRIGVVHLGDSRNPPDEEQDRHRLGQGILPLRSIVRALRDVGYDGYYDVELMGQEIETSNYRELLQTTQQAWSQLVLSH